MKERRAVDVRVERLQALADVARLLTDTLDSEIVGQRIVDSICTLLHAESSALYRYDADAETLSAVTVARAAGEPFRWSAVLPRGHGVAGRAVAERHPVVSSDISIDARLTYGHDSRARVAASTHRALLAVPLTARERLFGALVVAGQTGRVFDDEEVHLAQAFADQAAVALENARLYQASRQYAERLQTLHELNRLVSASLDVDEVLRNIAAAVGRFFNAPAVSVWIHDAARRRVHRAFTWGDDAVAKLLLHEVDVGEGVVGWAVAHRAPAFAVDMRTDRRAIDPNPLVGYGLPYLSAYPIVVGERVLGAFVFNQASRAELSPEIGALLASLAAQAGIALDNARLYGETAHRLEETRALLDVATLLNSTLETRELLKRVAIRVAQICGVDRCSLELWDGERVVPVASQFADGRSNAALWRDFKGLLHAPRAAPAHAQAIETRRPVVIDDAARTELIPAVWVEHFGLRAYMAVPLIRQDKVIGVMSLDYCERPGPFQPWQVELAMAVGGQLALAIANTQLYAELQERLRETRTLLAVSDILSRPMSSEETMRRVAREVGRAFRADMVGVYVLDPARAALVPMAGYHVPPALREHFMTNPFHLDRMAKVREVWQRGRVLASSDVHADALFEGDPWDTLPPHALLWAPTMVRGEPCGAIFLVWWGAGRAFAPADIRLLEGVAAQVGLAMENVELARQTRLKLRDTETLLSVSRALSSTLDLHGLLRHFVRRVAHAIEAETVGVWMSDDGGEWLEPAAGYRVPRERLDAVRRIRLSMRDDAFYAEAVQSKRPVVASDVMSDPRIPDRVRDAAPHRTELFVPIVAKERVVGGFMAVWWQRAREFSPDALPLMEAIANQAGVALENARLFAENRRQVEELSVLHVLSRAITGQLDRSALVDALAEQLPRVFAVPSLTVIMRADEGPDFFVMLRLSERTRDPAEARLRHPHEGLWRRVVATRRPVRTADYAGECARLGLAPVPLVAGFRHWLGAPMIGGDDVLGVVILNSADRPFTAADERLLANIADLAALALRSARLFEERTRAYRELTEAQDQLVRTEKLRALGEMASGVAHDFNNLLASILGRAQLLLARVEDPLQRRWLEVIERSAIDGGQTVRRLQDFTRIRRDHPLVAVMLNDVVQEALEITQSRWRDEAMSHGVTLEVRTELGDVPPIAGDPAELREALTNLILNAVDAMPEGGTLTLRTARHDNGVHLAVADTGVGISDNVRDKIFDPFFTTKGPRGTGLGLSMTYGILSRHGARIDVTSAVGRGSTFTLVFPPREELVAPAEPRPAPLVTSAHLRCLVIDDEESVGGLIGEVLESAGHAALVCRDAAEALRRFAEESFDVVFTDLAMPGMNGWQLANAVKTMRPAVPVFMVTGFGVELSEEECRRHGVEAVLVKPLAIESILDAAARAAQLGTSLATEGTDGL